VTASSRGAAAATEAGLLGALSCWACFACLACSMHDAGGGAGGTSSPSCAASSPGLSDCGEKHESCCATLPVPGGTYYRTYTSDPDGGGAATAEADPATVSGFRLDKYDVTVGRFRAFVAAWSTGWSPAAGAGKHAHLRSGAGLSSNGADGGFEPGWVAADAANLAPTNDNLGSCAPYSTWTDAPGAQESLPIDCINWWEAYAFCIWDGGFLPSEAEWQFAASGGSEEREYPWGSADPGATNRYAIYGDGNDNCLYPTGTLAPCTGTANIAAVGTAALGAGRFGQLDLAGNMWQWNLDWHDPAYAACDDCFNGAMSASRVFRGGLFNYRQQYLMAPSRLYGPPDIRDLYVGVRCARAP
jgi:formylglycine-generating enzyme required for sulfatase activity